MHNFVLTDFFYIKLSMLFHIETKLKSVSYLLSPFSLYLLTCLCCVKTLESLCA